MKFIALVLVHNLIFTCTARAGISHGAFFAFDLTSDYLVVAVDSRRQNDTAGGTVVTDDQCKIAPLGDRAIFLPAGVTTGTDPRLAPFDVLAMAAAAYRQAPQPISLQQAARSWGDDVRARLEAYYPLYRALFDQQYIGDVAFGYFLGFDADGTLGGALADISHRQAGGAFQSDVVAVPKPATGLAGHRGEVGEFFAGTTPRAGAVTRRLIAESAGKSNVEKQMIRMKLIVEAVPPWAGDSSAGGDVAQVIFEKRTGGWRWFHRPKFCPEH